MLSLLTTLLLLFAGLATLYFVLVFTSAVVRSPFILIRDYIQEKDPEKEEKAKITMLLMLVVLWTMAFFILTIRL